MGNICFIKILYYFMNAKIKICNYVRLSLGLQLILKKYKENSIYIIYQIIISSNVNKYYKKISDYFMVTATKVVVIHAV